MIDYKVQDVAESDVHFDLIIDIAGNRSLSSLRRLLVTDGTVMLVGGEGGNRWIGRLDRQLRGVAWSPFLRHNFRNFIASQPLEDLEALTDLIEAGKVSAAIDKTYLLHEVPEAIQHQKDGLARGKLVIKM